MFIDFTERGKGETEKNQCGRETAIDSFYTHPDQELNPQPAYVPWPGIEPSTFLVYETVLLPTEPPGQGHDCFYN